MDESASDPVLDVSADTVRDVSRRVLGDPEAELTTWHTQRIDHESIIDTTGGLHVVAGTSASRGEGVAWSCVAKVIRGSAEAGFRDSHDWGYWRREGCFFESEVCASLPTSLRPPKSFGVSRPSDEEDCIWMEHVAGDVVGEWRMDDFHRVARSSGEFAGEFVMGRPVPSAAWLAPSFFASALAADGLWAGFMDPANDESAWSSSVVLDSFDEVSRARCLAIWRDRGAFLAGLDRLPRALCHNDFHRRNVMLPTTGAAPVVLDWAFCGPGAVGTDLGQLVATTLFFPDVAIADAIELERAVLTGYVEGLRRSGWDGDERSIRLGYATAAALWKGTTLPGWVAFYMSEPDPSGEVTVMGRPAAEMRARWIALHDFALDLADEARVLARALL